MESKYIKNPIVTMPILADFNYYLKQAIWEYEMSNHVHEHNLIDVYYFRNIKTCIDEDYKYTDSKFDAFKDKWFIFKLFPGFGNSIILTKNTNGTSTFIWHGLWPNLLS